jgi:hypothetical protein
MNDSDIPRGESPFVDGGSNKEDDKKPNDNASQLSGICLDSRGG